MEYKIIHTDSYLLVVDDSEIKKETYCYDSINNILVFYKGSMKNIGFQKIIAHLPLNNSPILEGVALLPDLPNTEKDVEKLARDFYYSQKKTPSYAAAMSKGFKEGYNKAKDKFAYTEEDLRKAFKSGQKYGEDNSCNAEIHLNLNETQYIQSLQQPKLPIAFDFIDKIYKVKSGTIQEHKDGVAGYEYYEWVGTYKY